MPGIAREVIASNIAVLAHWRGVLSKTRDEGRELYGADLNDGRRPIQDVAEDLAVGAALRDLWDSTLLDVHLASSWDPWIVTLSYLHGDGVEDGDWLIVHALGDSWESAADALVQAIEAAIPQLDAALKRIGALPAYMTAN